MKTSHLFAILAAITFVAIIAPEANAGYNPTLGRFMQRDPGSGGMNNSAQIGAASVAVAGGSFPRDPVKYQYADGMCLYQYVRSNPVVRRDSHGLQSSEVWEEIIREREMITPKFSVDITRPGQGNGVEKGSIAVTIRVKLHRRRCCDEVKFIQIVKDHVEGYYLDRGSDEEWVVDEVDGSKWYPTEGPDKAGDYKIWSMRDNPGGTTFVHWLVQNFETCAVCTKTSKNNFYDGDGEVLGCVRWGHFWRRKTGQHIINNSHPRFRVGYKPSKFMLEKLK